MDFYHQQLTDALNRAEMEGGCPNPTHAACALILGARAHRADTNEYPRFPLGPLAVNSVVGGQEFDDWAADVAETAMKLVGRP